jgi:hypothetical protein
VRAASAFATGTGRAAVIGSIVNIGALVGDAGTIVTLDASGIETAEEVGSASTR